MTVEVIHTNSHQNNHNIYRFLYEIWSIEISRSMFGMDHHNRIVKDELDDTAEYFIAVDPAGEIEGCIRSNILDQTSLPGKIGVYLEAEKLINLLGGEKICYASHFAIAPKARGRTVASLLIAELYRYCLSRGIEAGLCYSALNYVSFYYQLGYRPYTANFRINAGIRIPLIHCARDKSYLEEIKSPLMRLLKQEDDDGGRSAEKIAHAFKEFRKPHFSRKLNSHLWTHLAHILPSTPKSAQAELFDGLTEQEQLIVSKRLLEITFSQGEYIYRRGETEQNMGLLLSGGLGVEATVGGTSRIINVIRPGEPFGEIHTLGSSHRTADIVALEKSQVLLLPNDFLERVSRSDTQLGLKLSKRLLKILAQRFMHFTDFIALEPQVSAYPQTTSNSHFNIRGTKPNEIESRIESYRFDNLGDQEGEFKRLIAQASIGEEIEFGMLKNLGLHDGVTILDLGSGPGVTSMLFAKHFPSCRTIGVEPEDLLRARAEKLIESQGLTQRCQFIKGTGDEIPVDDDSVDFCYARLVFQHLPNPMEVLAEMQRVTRPGGLITIMDVDDRSNIIHPSPDGLEELERHIAEAQAESGGDRQVGRKLYGYMHAAGLQDVGITHVPITAADLGRQTFFSIVYSFKRQVLERSGKLDELASSLFTTLEEIINRPDTFAMTTVFVAHGKAT